MISFSPCGVLKPCVYCVPFSSQSGGGSGVCVCACVYGWDDDDVCVVCCNLHSFFPRLCFVFPKGVTAFKGLFTPGSSVCNILSSLLFFPLFFLEN